MNVDRVTLQVDPSLELAVTYMREVHAGISRGLHRVPHLRSGRRTSPSPLLKGRGVRLTFYD